MMETTILFYGDLLTAAEPGDQFKSLAMIEETDVTSRCPLCYQAAEFFFYGYGVNLWLAKKIALNGLFWSAILTMEVPPGHPPETSQAKYGYPAGHHGMA
jgi:hypothetical protein